MQFLAMQSYKRFIALISFIIILSAVTMLVAAAEDIIETEPLTSEDGNAITSAAAIIIDFDTGLVIYELNADELRVPASMTKMFAAYVVFDALREEQVSLDTTIEISDDASTFSYVRAYTNVPLPRNSLFTIRELLEAVIVRSASAATIALGEALFGSEEAMVAKMNEKASQLGITADFHDSWGLSPDNRVSARGMAVMTRSFIKEYPEILDFTSQSSILFDEIVYRGTNPLIESYSGVDGFKTGFTNPAGWCFTGTAYNDGRRIISVTMGSEFGERFPDTVILLDYGFANYDSTIVNHFRNAVISSDLLNLSNSVLVPLAMYNIAEARYIDLRDLAILLNES